jgi:hypothetical protein
MKALLVLAMVAVVVYAEASVETEGTLVLFRYWSMGLPFVWGVARVGMGRVRQALGQAARLNKQPLQSSMPVWPACGCQSVAVWHPGMRFRHGWSFCPSWLAPGQVSRLLSSLRFCTMLVPAPLLARRARTRGSARQGWVGLGCFFFFLPPLFFSFHFVREHCRF